MALNKSKIAKYATWRLKGIDLENPGNPSDKEIDDEIKNAAAYLNGIRYVPDKDLENLRKAIRKRYSQS
jgi:hypothetical protein